MANGPYTQEGIMSQIFVAFGQGTGMMRVSHEAVAALHDLYFDAITPDIVSTQWATQAVQVLERIRALGRLAALKAVTRGDTTVSAEDVSSSAPAVHAQSDTAFCPPLKP
jgi:hypothetical protein